ncbi:MAG TPA: ATP-binding protein [Alphaproteobacteria bacterium]|nr:ATP-binding protein [Alphaproteobacteria bacterium]HBF98939.1 ATP-binding protein [Alphaproteobacteria bacterium]
MTSGTIFNAAWLASQTPAERTRILQGLPAETIAALPWLWRFWARPDQLPPQGEWTSWIMLGGRGAGKTRAGAEWVRASVAGRTPLSAGARGRLALVGETLAAARDVMVEGESGILAISPDWARPKFEPSKRRLSWDNGAVAQIFSADDPDSLRGPQFDGAWADELAKWRYGRESWDMLQFGLRLGADPRQIVTTTPRPVRLLRELMADQNSVVTRVSTYANRPYLAPQFFRRIIAQYEGTRLGRQELMAEMLSDNPEALWRLEDIDAARVVRPPRLRQVVVAVDPPASAHRQSDACGIVVAGIGADGAGYVLADHTVQGVSPQGWAGQAVAACYRHDAAQLLVEVNQGGDMAEAVIRQVDERIVIRQLRASRGKAARAEPVSALYEQGRVHHVGTLPELETEMTEFTAGFDRRRAGWSPDRVDALVWALTALMLHGEAGSPRLRRL